ncbi:hypothetical protein ACCO45_004209 [Purpureocillium lilacinum]|uniref:Uncharacterized protein n=1 Tax=Purpureocillium lilacinum TaxID=33203 RepID=A0ACC4E237_PURLI
MSEASDVLIFLGVLALYYVIFFYQNTVSRLISSLRPGVGGFGSGSGAAASRARITTAATTKPVLPSEVEVLVVGSGNAGLSAALAAAQAGARRVLVVDKCPASWAGGNSYFTAGAYRFVHGGLDDVRPLVGNLDGVIEEKIDLPAYTHEDFEDDLRRVCGRRSDPRLVKALVDESAAAVRWLARLGVRFHLSFNRQAYVVHGKIKFWGGLCLRAAEGGKSLIRDLQEAARRHAVHVAYSTAFLGLERDWTTGELHVSVDADGVRRTIAAKAVVLAAGGFEANPRLRSRYLGPGWDMALVRGTPYNTGEVLETAMRCLDAAPASNWSGCHSVAWDARADPLAGDRDASNELTKSGYPLGLMLNLEGVRFVDEGADLRNYTTWLRNEEYRPERVHRVEADTLEELGDKLCAGGEYRRSDSTRQERLLAHHPRVQPGGAPSPGGEPSPEMGPLHQGRPVDAVQGHAARSAQVQLGYAAREAPFLAVRVTCGITFTFGGLKVDPATAQLLRQSNGHPNRGIYCVGEMMGGLFYQNYPGGSGLTAGTVFGRRAGQAAAAAIKADFK